MQLDFSIIGFAGYQKPWVPCRRLTRFRRHPIQIDVSELSVEQNGILSHSHESFSLAVNTYTGLLPCDGWAATQ
eukprot:5104827-Alexandrium_andersonii.AAC.1